MRDFIPETDPEYVKGALSSKQRGARPDFIPAPEEAAPAASEPETASKSETKQTDTDLDGSRVPCTICGKLMLPKGLAAHTRMAHKDQPRDVTANDGGTGN